MRALCAVRAGGAGGAGGGLSAGARLLALRVPSQAQPLHFVVEAKARGRELRAQALRTSPLAPLHASDVFGLAVLQDGEYLFVDLDSKLSKYAPKSWRSSHTHGLDANGKPLLELHLAVQFHVESPLLLREELARRLYFLQMRHNVRSRDALPQPALLLLAGLALQAEHGDAQQYGERAYFRAEDYAPPSLAGDWLAPAMRACHREHAGLARAAAEERYIREVCLLPDTVNSHRYRMKRRKSEPEPGSAWLLVAAKGIKVLPDDGAASDFIWSAIGKLSFDRRRFEIRTEQGKLTLYSSSDAKAKVLFALCKDTHQFSMRAAPRHDEVLRREREQRRACFGFPRSCEPLFGQSEAEQRVSVISTSSTTTSGIVSDRVQSEDELEIMIDTPPAPAAPSTESLAFAHLLDRADSFLAGRAQGEDPEGGLGPEAAGAGAESETGDELSESADEPPVAERLDGCDGPREGKGAGSQCSSSGSTVIMAGASGPLYDGLGPPATVAASSETSGVYTMAGSELTAGLKADALSEDGRTDYSDSHYGDYEPTPLSAGALADFDGAGGAGDARGAPGKDCVDGGLDADPDGLCPLSAAQLSALIVARRPGGSLDSADYARPPPLRGDSYLRGHEDTAPSDDFFDRAPTPPERGDSRLPAKPPPPYDFAHRTLAPAPAPPAYPRRVCREPPPPADLLVAMMKLQLPPPPRLRRLPPPPPPLPLRPSLRQQLRSDADFVYFPLQSPAVSRQNYLEHKLAQAQSDAARYRSAPFLSCCAPPAARFPPFPPAPPLPRTASSADLLAREPPPARARRTPPPPPAPPPPYEPKKKPRPPLREEPPPELDIRSLREKSRHLDLPLIAALCNDRSLLKQTEAFVPRSRNPRDKLPSLPSLPLPGPRALSNTYVAHPGVQGKRPQPSS